MENIFMTGSRVEPGKTTHKYKILTTKTSLPEENAKIIATKYEKLNINIAYLIGQDVNR